MAYQLTRLTPDAGADAGANAAANSTAELRENLARLIETQRPRYRRLWAYYRNAMLVCGVTDADAGADRPYRQSQEWGLPSRITGARAGSEISFPQPIAGVARKEVVIENDIAWRVETMVDYLFGKDVVIASLAANAKRAKEIEQLLRAIIDANGGVQFLQQLALLGAVYGFVDVLVKFQAENAPAPHAPAESSRGEQGGQGRPAADAPAGDSPPALGLDDSTDTGASIPSQRADIPRLARMIRLEIVEPARALPLLSQHDYRIVNAYGQVWERPSANNQPPIVRRAHWMDRLLAWRANGNAAARGQSVQIIEIISPDRWQRYENEVLIGQGANSLGEIPLVHIQNTALPFSYPGQSDVEPLIPLQDELNTRLSDRANRITLQSFKMYLGKGIENFNQLPVSPGRMWMSDNDQADIVEFGGDSGCPSETEHIGELREALDKTSGVSPIAAGAIKGRIGRLTSAAALRVTLLSLLAKTDRKRTTYGQGLIRICELSLAWLDKAGAFKTTPDERGIELHWPSPLPENDLEKLQEAEIKHRLGIAPEILLKELGY